MRRVPRTVLAAGAAALVVAWLVAARAGGLGDDLEWVAVERGDLVVGVEVEGELEATEASSLTPPAIPRHRQFRIAFMAPEGQRVRAGQPVLAFDTTELEIRLQERTADRDSAAAEMAKARTDLAKRRSDAELRIAEARAELRRRELALEVPEELVAANELAVLRIDRELAAREIAHLEERLALVERQADAELRALTERRDRAASRVEEIRDHLARMRLVAPRDGVVVYSTDWRGEKLKVGDTVWRGRPVLQVPDLDRLRVAGRIGEADVGAVGVGQRATLRLDAHPDRQVVGRVSEIGRSVQRRSPLEPERVVRLEIALDAVDPQLMRPGMRLRGEIEVARLEGVLTVPTAAVAPTPEGPVVFVRGAFGVRAVRPELGRWSGDGVEVLSGLAPGDRVALGTPDGTGEARP